jgi:protein NrfD
MEKKQEYWEGLAAGYFFLSSMGAMMLITIAVMDLVGVDLALTVNGWASLAALVLVGIGGLMLMAEAGNIAKAYLIMSNFKSMATLNAFMMTLLMIFAFIYATFFFDFIPWSGMIGLQKIFAVLGIITGLLLVSVHGLELGESRGRSFWNAGALVPVFIVSSAASGMAGVLLAGAVLGVIDNPAMQTINGVLAGILILQLIVIVSYIQGMKQTGAEEAKRAVENILHGDLQLGYWGGVIALGTILPLLMYALAATATIIAVKGILIIIGGICFRQVFLAAAVRRSLPGEDHEWSSVEESLQLAAKLEKRWQEKASWLYPEK